MLSKSIKILELHLVSILLLSPFRFSVESKAQWGQQVLPARKVRLGLLDLLAHLEAMALLAHKDHPDHLVRKEILAQQEQMAGLGRKVHRVWASPQLATLVSRLSNEVTVIMMLYGHQLMLREFLVHLDRKVMLDR
jgi:hypothetical protein